MKRSRFIFLTTLCLMLACAQLAMAQEWPDYVRPSGMHEHDIDRGPGFYFAWWKFVVTIPVFLFWVKVADWINRDTELVAEKTEMTGDVWNSVTVFSFFAGFLALLTIPFFFLGYPVYLASALVPFIIYVSQRNSHFEGAEKVFTRAHLAKRRRERGMTDAERAAPAMAPLPQDAGPAMDFTAAGPDNAIRQRNLIFARQNPAFIMVKTMLHDALLKRAETIRMDFTQQAVGVRYQIDGLWHANPPLDRQSGDAMLTVLKTLGNLNPMDRRNRQEGEFEVKTALRKLNCQLRTQGVQTGETVLLNFTDKKKHSWTLEELGMSAEMQQRLKAHTKQPGYLVISAMPGDGLSTTWLAVLNAIDRTMKDFVGLIEPNNPERTTENIAFTDVADGSDLGPVMKLILLKQPDAFVVPNPMSGDLIDRLCELINKEEKFAISHVRAKSACEALLRMLNFKCDRTAFAKAVTMVLFQRLVRRLCDGCKQPYQAAPQLAQKFGLDPRQPLTLYREYQPPPPEQMVDEKGRPIEIPICPKCAGMRYCGRIAMFELLEINDSIRKVLVSQPKLEALEAAAKKSKHKSIQEEGIQLVIAGVTSLNELQRVLKGS